MEDNNKYKEKEMRQPRILVKSFFAPPVEGYTDVSIARYAPRGKKGLRYLALAPNQITWDTAKRKDNWRIPYRKQLNTLNPHRVVEDINCMTNNGGFALLCWEHSPDSCHRKEVADWLINAGYEVEIK